MLTNSTKGLRSGTYVNQNDVHARGSNFVTDRYTQKLSLSARHHGCGAHAGLPRSCGSAYLGDDLANMARRPSDDRLLARARFRGIPVPLSDRSIRLACRMSGDGRCLEIEAATDRKAELDRPYLCDSGAWPPCTPSRLLGQAICRPSRTKFPCCRVPRLCGSNRRERSRAGVAGTRSSGHFHRP